MMHTFYVDGKRVTQRVAHEYWISSHTYRNANKRTRASIWRTALSGDESGNHNPHGEVDHLREAGIELR